MIPSKEELYPRDLVTEAVYASIHQWLRYHYGRATHCEGKECIGKSKKYEWALAKGKEYERNRENFIMLCKSCHVLYDVTERFRGKMRELNKNTHKTHCVNGHELTEDNVYHPKYKYRDGSPRPKYRQCRECKRISSREQVKKRSERTPSMLRAIVLIRDNPSITAKRFGELFWPDHPGHQEIKVNGSGKAKGKGVWRLAGGYLGNLLKKEVVERCQDSPNMFRVTQKALSLLTVEKEKES